MNAIIRVIARNKKAYHDYEVIETVEAGIALQGTEVKSVRAGKINLVDSFAQCRNGIVMVNNLHISPYEQGSYFNHEAYRKRILLLKKQQIIRLSAQVDQKNLTLVPLQVYFKNQWVKLELGLCRGRKQYDKREHIAKQESKRQLDRMVRAAHR